jgi:predicted DNA-binding transcriptional regulator AlpA
MDLLEQGSSSAAMRQLYKLMNKGKFLKVRRIGAQTVGRDSAEVAQWIAERLAAPGGSGNPPCE